jgi:hypothetical protein
MARELLILTLTTLLIMPQVVFASGGNNPPPSGNVKLISPRLAATIVVDPHNPIDTTNGWATVRIHKKEQYSSVVFQMPDPNSGFSLKLGCQLFTSDGSDLTEIRFLYAPLLNWMPAEAITYLLAGVGITFSPLDPTFVPMITSVENAVCTPVDSMGVLSFDAIIEFLVPCGPGTAYKKCPKN